MSLLFFDGAGEYYNTAHIKQVWDGQVNATILPTGGRRGGAGLSVFEGQDVFIALPDTATVVCGFAVKMLPNTLTTRFLLLRYQGLIHLNFMANETGAIVIQDGTTVVLGQSAPGVVRSDVWHFIELKATISDTGSVVVRVDGTEVINLPNVDTLNGSDAFVNNVVFASETLGVTSVFDDIYILDTTAPAPQDDFLGDVQVDALLPTGTGTTSDFDTTNGSATHYQNVDENPADADTTYNETPTANDVDLFTYPALAAITGGSSVVSVQALALAKRPDLGYSNIALVARPAATNRIGTSLSLQTSYRYKNHIWDDNPDGGDWTETAVNNSEFGVQKP